MSAAPAHPPFSQRLGATLSNSFRARRLTLDGLDTSEIKEAAAKHEEHEAREPKARSRKMSLSPEMTSRWAPSAQAAEELFPKTVVGTFSCHGTEPSRRPGAPAAKINQDRGMVSYPFAGNDAAALFACFDGHGLSGDSCSQFVANTLQALLEDHPALFEEPERALKETFVRVDELLEGQATIETSSSGTTATVVLLIEGTLYTACVGDSRAVIASNGRRKGQVVARDLSRDHKPDLPDEHARIKKRGGFVSPPEDWGGPARVYLDPHFTAPGLAMSRSIGDHAVKRIGVTAEPEVTTHKLTADDAFLVIASDGVWEFLASDVVATLVAPLLAKGGATVACTKLIERATAEWRKEEGDYRDDITALVIKLPCLPTT